jgi:hypothetical protein
MEGATINLTGKSKAKVPAVLTQTTVQCSIGTLRSIITGTYFFDSAYIFNERTM